jgi:LL-diaminopimelate aminotransferase
MISPAKRILTSGNYIFEEIAQMKRKDPRPASDIFDLGVGSPDQRPDPDIFAMLDRQVRSTTHQNHRYSPFDGAPEFRNAVSSWYKRRFGVTVNPDGEALPLAGPRRASPSSCSPTSTRATPS